MRLLTVTIALLAAAPAAAESYHGFTIDPAAANGPERATLVTATQRQIDLVERAGLTPPTLVVLRSFPIQVRGGAGGGHFGRDGVVVNLKAGDDARPILLHELMHVYMARILPGGARNPELQRYFARAHTPGLYPEASYMLKNVQEYFAMTASVYLNGSAARPPFTRQKLEQAQPAYAAWLGQTVR